VKYEKTIQIHDLLNLSLNQPQQSIGKKKEEKKKKKHSSNFVQAAPL
jgi:hypothetical protein